MITILIFTHLLLFQGMFIIKNIVLRKKLGKSIRGNNKEANVAISLFILIIVLSCLLSMKAITLGTVLILSPLICISLGTVLLFITLGISLFSLIGLRDSWRVGIVENQKTELITTGIYRFSRNPYFVSYLLLFLGYTTLLQNLILLGLSLLAFIAIHRMILKEEQYLTQVHGETYLQYMKRTPRYLLF